MHPFSTSQISTRICLTVQQFSSHKLLSYSTTIFIPQVDKHTCWSLPSLFESWKFKYFNHGSEKTIHPQQIIGSKLNSSPTSAWITRKNKNSNLASILFLKRGSGFTNKPWLWKLSLGAGGKWLTFLLHDFLHATMCLTCI